jgi:hypothetical protein
LPKKDIKGDIEGGRTFMLMNQKNQHCENGWTTESNSICSKQSPFTFQWHSSQR